MHMTVKNTLYLFILIPIMRYPYLFWVGESKYLNISANGHPTEHISEFVIDNLNLSFPH